MRAARHSYGALVSVQDLLVHSVTWIQSNLILLLPFILILMRLIVMRLAGESAEEFGRNVLNVPIDLSFAAIGIVLSALHNDFPGFTRRFGNHTGGVGALIVIIIGVMALLFTALNRFIDKLGKNFVVAMREVQSQMRNPGFTWDNAGIGVAGRVFWAMRYITGFVLLWGIQMVLAYATLRYIAGSVV